MKALLTLRSLAVSDTRSGPGSDSAFYIPARGQGSISIRNDIRFRQKKGTSIS